MASKAPSGKPPSIKGITSAGSSPAHVPRIQEQTQPLTIEMIQQVVQGTENKLIEKIQTISDELSAVIDNKIRIVTEELAARNVEIREDILLAFKGLADQVEDLDLKVEDVKEVTETLSNKLDGAYQRIDRTDQDITLLQYREMEYAIRIRGVKEDRQENLRKKIGEALATLLGLSTQEMNWQMDKIYRVNSWIARQRKLPRDIVIYFTTRCVRNDVLQATYKKKLEVQSQEVMTMKEIPPKMLRSRREYSFLVEELKNRQLQYRWDVPAGLVVNFQGERYRLNSILKAKDFYENTLKAGRSKTPDYKSKSTGEQKSQEELMTIAQVGTSSSQEDLLQVMVEVTEDLPRDQRMTRAATAKRKEVLKNQQQQSLTPCTTTLEVVGGARPKTRYQLDNQQMLQRLQRFKDGN